MRKSFVFVMMILTISHFITLASYPSQLSLVTSTIDLSEELHGLFYHDTDHHGAKADKGIINEVSIILSVLLLTLITYSLYRAFVSRHFLHAAFYQSNYLITSIPLSQK
ncbi:hypothetical protein SH601_10245 [Gracilibacillus sp. S3-1-1]|uniref:Uncharacterized protein n=1 Tax=Gracilibacillus pellucidus TaxID=3095368 RepID=A0ACC6M5U2_9BACI|nr:hypothetical protein [Gracilibacillus sp. S3-1-1]MDX8046360.1 hypothetical protein [Gracilibacillus sp. S3-1-1]